MKFQHFEQKDNRPADCFWFVGNTDLSTANFRIVGDTTSFRDSLRTEGSSECHDLKSSPIRPRLAIQNWRAVIRRWESLWAGSFRCPPMRQYSRWSSPLGTVHKRTSHLLCGQRMVTLFRRREAFKSTTTQQNWARRYRSRGLGYRLSAIRGVLPETLRRICCRIPERVVSC